VLAPTSLLGFAAMIALTVAANLLLKLGAGVTEVFSAGSPWRGWHYSGVAGSSTPSCCDRCRSTSAVSFTAAQFVGVVIAASLVLGEPISPARWLGIACISFGIFLVGLTAQA